MNLIIDRIPEAVEIGGREVPINTDFRFSILFELLMQDKNVSPADKFVAAIKLYYDEDIPREYHTEAVERLLWFYTGGRISEDKPETSDENTQRRKARQYSFEADDIYIYAAFLEQYGIDLQDEDIHWWKFRALFRSLKEDCKMGKIMGYRAMTINANMSKSDQRFYRQMQIQYALPDERTEEEKETDFAEMLGF